MRRRLHARLSALGLACAWATGCEPDQGFGRVTPESNPGTPVIEFSIDIALQRAAWGQALGRCHLQAALRTYEPKDDEMAPYTGESGGGQIALPDRPLSCVYTAIEAMGPPIEPGSPSDNWAIAGADIAADEIHLESDEGTIVLQTVETQTGAIRYEWTDCSPDTFPFGQVFDLHLPDDADAYISGFDIPSAFAVGPDLVLRTPDAVEHRVFHDQSIALDVSWEELHTIPDVRGEAVDVERTLWARNRAVDDPQPFEALACWPEADGMVLEPDDLAQLSASTSAADPETVVGLQVDTVVTSPPFEAPWGSTVSVRSTVSDGGDLVLFSVPED